MYLVWQMKVSSWSCLIWNPRKYFKSPIIDISNFCTIILLNSSQEDLLVDPNIVSLLELANPGTTKSNRKKRKRFDASKHKALGQHCFFFPFPALAQCGGIYR
jgi:hypothetical protein